jgi:adenylate cyclase
LTAAVLDREGAIDKYLGDGLMAYWNAPVETTNHAARACDAALAMIECLPDVDARAKALAIAERAPHIPVSIGVGVNTGRAFVGNMGSEQRFDYSMVGDPVNIAARLEAATKEFGVPVIVSEETRRRARGFRFLALGPVALKGRRGVVHAFALHGREGDVEPDFEAFSMAHEACLATTGQPAFVAARDRAAAFPQGARYAAFYARLASGEPLAPADSGKLDL